MLFCNQRIRQITASRLLPRCNSSHRHLLQPIPSCPENFSRLQDLLPNQFCDRTREKKKKGGHVIVGPTDNNHTNPKEATPNASIDLSWSTGWANEPSYKGRAWNMPRKPFRFASRQNQASYTKMIPSTTGSKNTLSIGKPNQNITICNTNGCCHPHNLLPLRISAPWPDPITVSKKMVHLTCIRYCRENRPAMAEVYSIRGPTGSQESWQKE